MNQEIKNLPILHKAGVFALVCVGILCLMGAYYLRESYIHQNARNFSVSGKGEVDVHATKATISADFVGEGATSDEATTKLSELSKKTFDGLAQAEVSKDDIKTQSVSVNPKYEWCYSYPSGSYPIWCKGNPNQNRITGYEATQNFTVTIKDDKSKVEKILGLFPTLGARNVNGPNWEVDNKAAINEARTKAVADAKAKAQAIADSLGMSLGDVTYYSEDQGGGYPTPIFYSKAGNMTSARAEMAPMAAMDASIPVSEGTDKVTVNVSVTYELR
jgi:uncharacterized protein YggE